MLRDINDYWYLSPLHYCHSSVSWALLLPKEGPLQVYLFKTNEKDIQSLFRHINVLTQKSNSLFHYQLKNVRPEFTTRFNNCSIVHENHHISFVHKLYAVGAKDSGLAPEDPHDASLHEVMGHVRVYCCQWIIQEENVFLLVCLKERLKFNTKSKLLNVFCYPNS